MSAQEKLRGWFQTKSSSQFIFWGFNAFLIGVSIFSLTRFVQRWNYNVLERIYINTDEIFREIEKLKEDYLSQTEAFQEEKFDILAAINSFTTASYNTSLTRITVAKWIEANLIADISKHKQQLLHTSELMLKELKISQEWFRRGVWFFQKHQSSLGALSHTNIDPSTRLIFKLSTTLEETVALLSNFVKELKHTQ